MTDINANQLASVIPELGTGIAGISQLAIVVPSLDAPPVAGGATVNQIAIVTVGFEYKIPLHLHGWLTRSIQGFPYYIEEDGL